MKPLRLPAPEERVWKLWLPCVHYAAGFYLLMFALYTHTLYVLFYNFPADFSAYFRAAHIALTAPANLYNDAFYASQFRGSSIVIPYIYPPTFLLVLWPFAFLSYATAYYVWIALNLVASFVLCKKIRTLCEQNNIEKYKSLLASMAVGIAVWGYVLIIGQTSIIMTMAIVLFLLGWQNKQYKAGAFWLAAALCLKPHFFIPLLFFMAGNKQYKFLGYCLMWGAVFVGLSMLIVGYQPYLEYITRITAQQTQVNEYVSNFKGMINVRGILTSLLTADDRDWIARVALILYAGVMVVCFFIGRMQLSTTILFPLVLSLSWFFSPWLHIQDCYCLLPAAVLMLSHLTQRHKTYWLLPSYLLIAVFTVCAPIPIFTPYALGKDPYWFYRTCLILLMGLAAYITSCELRMARKPGSSA